MILFKRKKRHFAEVEITPLIDIVFLLLIFFMLSSTFLKPAIKMNLPVIASRGFEQKAKITISVDTEENIFINKKKIELSQITQELKKNNNLTEINFRADKRTSYGLIIQIMEKLKSTGIKKISLEHELIP
ncbi:MAG: biopolymer transporter ExbD [Candidatus Margulisbacteria bacterium]|nr:biopolymer transporter ExbD [Candidatus Margulisiibacteriota bacterium]